MSGRGWGGNPYGDDGDDDDENDTGCLFLTGAPPKSSKCQITK